MANTVNRIALLTSGGDSQGMNAAVYAVTRYALSQGLEVLAIDRGYQGLIDGDIRPITAQEVDDIIHRGGTIVKTSRCLDMKTEQGQQKAHDNLVKFGIDGLVVIGGDGSFQGAKVLSTKFGVLTMGIPGTIDNDLAYTDYTLGFDSAVNACMRTIKMVRDTMTANDRTCVVEVMGRDCGDIALYAGITSGAEVILVPEVEWNIEEVVNTIQFNASKGKFDNIVVVAEGVDKASNILSQIKQHIPGINIRDMVIGHLQRGGDASFSDRLLGLRMGQHAIDCLMQGKSSRVVGIRDDEIIDVEIVEALAQRRVFNKKLYDLSKQVVKF